MFGINLKKSRAIGESYISHAGRKGADSPLSPLKGWRAADFCCIMEGGDEEVEEEDGLSILSQWP